MKLLSRYSILLSCLLLALPVMSGSSYAQSTDAITESKVLAMLDSVDKATKKGNVAGIIGILAKDVKITMNFSSPDGKEHQLTFNKEQYASSARQGIRRRIAYEYYRNNTRMTISKDRKTAMVMSDVYETLTLPEGTFRGATAEIAILNLRDGKILVTSIEAIVRFY